MIPSPFERSPDLHEHPWKIPTKIQVTIRRLPILTHPAKHIWWTSAQNKTPSASQLPPARFACYLQPWTWLHPETQKKGMFWVSHVLLLPLCHPLALTHVGVEFHLDHVQSEIQCVVEAETVGKTGVEMEALTAVQIALLTIYDMCKAVDRGMSITDIHLIEKRGGKSGSWSKATK
jgi:hypothetical protein